MIEHADLVHHMLLYRCPSFVTQVYDKPCYMGDAGDACYSVVAGWGLGGGVRQRPFFRGVWVMLLFLFSSFVSCASSLLPLRVDRPFKPCIRRHSSFLRTWAFLLEVMTAIHITGWRSTTIMSGWKLVNQSHKI